MTHLAKTMKSALNYLLLIAAVTALLAGLSLYLHAPPCASVETIKIGEVMVMASRCAW